MKKIFSLIMSIVLLCTALLPLSVNAATTCNCNHVPIIYVRGKTPILPDKSKPASSTNHQLPYITGKELETYITTLVPIYAVCYLTGNFDRFSYKLAEIFAEEYKDYALDKNGNITNNSGIAPDYQWSPETVIDNHKPNKTVTTYQQASAEIYKYYFIYDCRIDPLETADELHDYIETVKKVTGHSKVKVLARCYGSNVVSAYFSKYGWDDIQDVFLYNPIMYGTDKLDCIFTGEMKITQDSIDYISENYVADSEEDETLKLMIEMLNKIGGFDFSNATTSYVINYCTPEILRATYATCPGFWAMLSADSYEKAKQHILTYYESDFAGIIAKTDNYHNNVRLRLSEMYDEMKADGVDIYTVVKYGTMLLPITEDIDLQSDDTVSVKTQVPGAITAPLGTTFGDDYIAHMKDMGKGEYISPDKVLDISEIAYPENTWFIRDLLHDNFPKVFDLFIYNTLRAKGTVTVDTFRDYPQYLRYEKVNNVETIKPLTSVDADDKKLDLAGDIFVFLQRIQSVLIRFITNHIKNFILN